MYTYLLINILLLLFVVAFSFESRVKFVNKWIFLLPSIIIAGGFCMVWNHYFTVWKIWVFNPEHVCGIYIFSLPLEQLLFFISVPFACIFIYELINHYFPGPGLGYRTAASISWTLMLLFATLAYLNSAAVYTALSAVFALILLLQHLLVFRQKYLGRFYRAFLVCLLPFLLVGGILSNHVITYDEQHILGPGIFNIPVEDFIYFYFMLLLNLTIYEYAKGKRRHRKMHVVQGSDTSEDRPAAADVAVG